MWIKLLHEQNSAARLIINQIHAESLLSTANTYILLFNVMF